MKAPVLVALAASNFGHLPAAVVVDNHKVSTTDGFPWPGLEHYYVGDIIVSRLGPTSFRAASGHLGDGFNYYILDLGFRFEFSSPSPDSLLFSNYQSVPISQSEFEIPDGESVFLGSEVIYIEPEFPGGPNLEIKTYGWIELENNGGELTSGGSATAYDLLGIFVGTTTPISEPSTILSLGFLPFALFGRRRNR